MVRHNGNGRGWRISYGDALVVGYSRARVALLAGGGSTACGRG